MIWKELFIERAGTLGGLGWWVGACLTLLLSVGSLTMTGLILWEKWQGSVSQVWSVWARSMLATGVGDSGLILTWLIQWAIGLRAAVTIASERERGTWDAILTSPLEAKEIIRAKLWGSLFALRWLLSRLGPGLDLGLGGGGVGSEKAMRISSSAALLVGAFMAAVGIRASLASETATGPPGAHDRSLARGLDRLFNPLRNPHGDRLVAPLYRRPGGLRHHGRHGHYAVLRINHGRRANRPGFRPLRRHRRSSWWPTRGCGSIG